MEKKFQFKKGSHNKRYKDKPDEIKLEDFLASSIHKAEEEAKLKISNRTLEQAYREHREDGKANTYAINRRPEKPKKAYLVYFKDDDNKVFIAFSKSKDQCKHQAVKYYRDNFYPGFENSKQREERFQEARRKRLPELDVYAEEGKVPIPVLLKLGFEFPCASCGKDNFTYEDYENKRCFIIEEDVDMNVYTKGVILCYSCYKRLIGEG